MPFKIKRTSDVKSKSITIMAYGPPGVGKTRLCATAPKGQTLILSAESGLLSVSQYDLDYIEVDDFSTLEEVTKAINGNSSEFKSYSWICLDSLSEIAEVVLAKYKGDFKDARRAYGETQDRLDRLVRWFRDVDRNVYMSLKQTRAEDSSGRVTFGPSMPSKKLTQGVAYFPDQVCTFRDAIKPDGTATKVLTFQATPSHPQLKDRSGMFGDTVKPSLEHISKTIQAGHKKTKGA